MALSHRGSRFNASIWPGFVDAMSALLMIVFFVLSIFMILQYVLRDTISTQATELDAFTLQVSKLGDALGLERGRADTQTALVATLTSERAAAQARIADFESQVASLLARNTDLTGQLGAAQTEAAQQLSQKQALDLALAQARSEIDGATEAARLDAAKREALEALVASLRSDVGALTGKAEALDATEAARLVEAAAAADLRKRLENSTAELTAMSLNLEEQRKKASETLTLLAAAEAARDQLQASQNTKLSDADRRAAELAQARALLAAEKNTSAESQKQVALLNQQTTELRAQLNSLQGLLDTAKASDADAQVQIETLGSNLNAALARVASEQSARADLEERERKRLEAESQDLSRYRSEFFGRMRDILGAREGVQVVGDRFVFPSEVLFAPGSATLGPEGQAQVARVAQVIREISGDIPSGIDWVLRVDGHTDSTPLSPGSAFADNWELSQARALSVVKYMIASQGIPANRLAATGFGEFQPIDSGSSPEALARNRRIELKFTER